MLGAGYDWAMSQVAPLFTTVSDMTPAYDFDLETEVCRDYIAARVRSLEINPALTQRFLRDIRHVLTGERFGHLLLEFELAHAMTEAEVLEVMQTFFDVMPGLKIAVVNRDSKHHPSLSFGAMVSQEFGQDYRYFKNAEEARVWLTGE